ncbi:hypothetical protein C8J56DRAFT_1038056 [Mycena floridula]|nr:hypothetical protein C8J56DRAFT_1038056 [Mycena floridula]
MASDERDQQIPGQTQNSNSRTAINDVLTVTKAVLTVSMAALDGTGFPGARMLPWLALQLIEIYETLRASPENLRSLVAGISKLQDAIIQPLVDQKVKESDVLCARLEELDRVLQNSIDRLDRVSAAIKLTNEEVAAAIGHFMVQVQIDLVVSIKEIPTKHDTAIEKLAYNKGARYDAASATGCLEGTRVQLLNIIHSYFGQMTSRPFMWLRGSPGTGKSAIAKTVAANLYSQSLLAASYFFDKRAGIGLRDFIPTIAWQLASYSISYRANLGEALWKDPAIAFARPEAQVYPLIIDPLRNPTVTISPSVIVVDALDECGNRDELESLMDILSECVNLPTHLRIFLTSRPEPEVIRVMEDEKLCSVVGVESMNHIDDQSTNRDIEAFVRHRFKRIKSSGWKPTEDDLRLFVDHCGNLFEIAAIRLREIEEARGRPKMRVLKAILEEGTNRMLRPEQRLGLEYEQILREAYSDDETVTPVYRRVIGALITLHEPLSLIALTQLLDIDVDDGFAVLEPLSSIIECPTTGVVRLFHASFQEFLLSESQDGTAISCSKFHFDSPQHALGAKSITALAWSHDAQLIASGTSEGHLYLWSAETGELLDAAFTKHPSSIQVLGFTTAGQVISLSDDPLCLRHVIGS